MSIQRPPEADRLDIEVATLARAYRKTVQLRRAEELIHRLEAHGPLEVLQSGRNVAGDRMMLQLDNGWHVKLWLFWPRRRSVIELSRMFWHDEVGWVIDTLDDDAQPMRCYAWRVVITLPKS
ncbi:MAG: hypothetical protein AB7R77_16970 [Ilumatobacteraceae bacterium]|jgi:hypothetical protein